MLPLLLRVSMLLVLMAGLIGCSAAPAAPAQAPQGAAAPAKELTIAEIANLTGADRQAILEAGARKEGAVMWYSVLIVDQVLTPIIDGFQKKYPFIKAEYYRAGGVQLQQKVLQERQAGQDQVDVVDGSDGYDIYKANGLLQPFRSPSVENWPESVRDKELYWASTYVNSQVFGYNSKLLPKADLPKTYDDLLDPKWKGKFGWSNSGAYGGPGFVGHILTSMGEQKGMEYLKALSNQEVINSRQGSRAVSDQVIAGEFPVNLNTSAHHVVISSEQGAPFALQIIEPVMQVTNVTVLMKNAKHPYSAMLLLDYVFSEEAQQVFHNIGYIPGHPNVKPKVPEIRAKEGGFKINNLTPSVVGQNMEKWTQTYQQLFVK